MERIVIALGGNAIQSGDATAEAQQAALESTVGQLVDIIKNGYNLIITHGNGPQVGNILLQQKAAASDKTPEMPLDTCGAMSQGMIGYWLENELEKGLAKEGIGKQVLSVVTRVLVDPKDEAFRNPTKPIGPFYSEFEAKQVMKQSGFTFKEDAGRGWRRVVPSPKPVTIKEHQIIRELVENGHIVVAVGGGGIPVVQENNEIHGVEAVIDKDFAAQKLAELVNADVLLILTAVPQVYIDFKKETERALEEVSVEELEKLASEGHFAPGSMLPKVEAAIQFARSKPGRKTIITSLDKAVEALQGLAGTRVVQESDLNQ
jgi:carbamate kinase